MLKYNKSCYSTGQFYPMLFPRSSSLHTFNNSSTNKNKWMDHGRQQSGITTALPASPAKVITLRLLIPNYHSVVKWTATKNDNIWTIRVQQQCNKRKWLLWRDITFFFATELWNILQAPNCVFASDVSTHKWQSIKTGCTRIACTGVFAWVQNDFSQLLETCY